MHTLKPCAKRHFRHDRELSWPRHIQREYCGRHPEHPADPPLHDQERLQPYQRPASHLQGARFFCRNTQVVNLSSQVDQLPGFVAIKMKLRRQVLFNERGRAGHHLKLLHRKLVVCIDRRSDGFFKAACFLVWCGRWESNPHSLRNGILNPARLPIPPRPHGKAACRLRRALIACKT